MSTLAPVDLRNARFRASPAFRIVPFAGLTAAQQLQLRDLQGHAAASDVLIPAPDSGHTVRSVDRHTAALLRGLSEAAPLPTAAAQFDGRAEAVLRLVFDGILEVECDGRFLSGVAAADRLVGATSAALPAGTVGIVSLEALRFAAALDERRPRLLADRLYRYNTRPLSPRWRSRLPAARAVADFLGVGADGADASGHGDPVRHEEWLNWEAPGANRRPGGTTWKLYVSPPAESLRDALPAVLALLQPRGPACAVKVGAELHTLLRPDKLVAYFDSREQLERGADLARGRLAGLPAQSVPFTAALSDDGLLSCGVDPPAGHALLRWQGSGSWRSWLANQLAAALATALAAPAAMPAWRFALERLRLDGVDTASFAPVGGAGPRGGWQ